MELLYALLVVLLVTRVFGEIAERFGQPALAGEIASGIVLGIVFRSFSQSFPLLASLPEDETFTAVTDLGIFFLMLMAGLELRSRDLKQASRSAVFVAIGGMALPLTLGILYGWIAIPASDYRIQQILFLGVALAITAVPVSVKVLMDLDRLKSRLGSVIVSAAVIDDVLSLLLLAVLTGMLETGALPSLAAMLALAGKMLLFFVLTLLFGRYVLPIVGPRIRRFQSKEFEFSFLLLLALGFAVLSEALGAHFILGAFVAGLFFERNTIDREVFEQVEARVTAIGAGFLGPIFFASIGLHLDLGAIYEVPGFVVVVILLASAGKLIGGSIPAAASGMSWRDACAVGVGMNARGAVSLVIADIALRAGLFSKPSPVPPVVQQLFSAVVLMAVVTTLLTPLGLRPLLRSRSK